MDSELAYALEGIGDQLQELIDQTGLTNSILSCGLLFLGIIAGLIFMGQFWRRF